MGDLGRMPKYVLLIRFSRREVSTEIETEAQCQDFGNQLFNLYQKQEQYEEDMRKKDVKIRYFLVFLTQTIRSICMCYFV